MIYLGLFGYTVWQALPGQRGRERQRALGWWIALTMVLNGAWLVTVQFAGVWATVVMLAVLLAALCATYVRAMQTRPDKGSPADAALIDGTTGLHLGWAALATVANVGAALTATGPSWWASAADVLGVLVVAVVVGLVLALAAWSRWRLAPGIAVGWGLSWLAVSRLNGDLGSVPIGVAAIAAAVVMVAVPVVMRGRAALAARAAA